MGWLIGFRGNRAGRGWSALLALALAVSVLAGAGGASAQLVRTEHTDPAEWDAVFARAEAASASGEHQEAIRMLLPQALEGHVRSQTRIGWMLDQGLGMLSDRCGATVWYDRAARAGDPEARFLLAASYLDGTGVARDAKLAHVWMLSAAANGYRPATRALEVTAERARAAGVLEAAEALSRSTPVSALPRTLFMRVPQKLFSWQDAPDDLGHRLDAEFGVASCYDVIPEQEAFRRGRLE